MARTTTAPAPTTTPAPATTAAPTTTRGSRRPVRRTVQLVVGLALYAASMAVMVHAGLGALPWDVLTQGIIAHVDASFGEVTVVLSVVVLALWWPLRQRPGIGTLANVAVIGVLVDPALRLVAELGTLSLVGRLGLMVLGIALNGVATALYIGARLGPGPRDGLMTGLVGRTGWPLAPVRIGIEVLVVGVGWLLGGTLGAGTLLYAVGVGPLVHVLLPRVQVPGR